LRERSIVKLAHQSWRFLCRRHQRIKIPIVPFCDGAIRPNKMRSPQIQEQPLVFRGNDFVTPVVRFRFIANVVSEKNKSVAMTAISGNDFRNCVSAGEYDREEQRDGAPSTDTRV
jgi:hypothetical protein